MRKNEGEEERGRDRGRGEIKLNKRLREGPHQKPRESMAEGEKSCMRQ